MSLLGSWGIFFAVYGFGFSIESEGCFLLFRDLGFLVESSGILGLHEKGHPSAVGGLEMCVEYCRVWDDRVTRAPKRGGLIEELGPLSGVGCFSNSGP